MKKVIIIALILTGIVLVWYFVSSTAKPKASLNTSPGNPDVILNETELEAIRASQRAKENGEVKLDSEIETE
jgi:hypothetical protein